MLEGQAAYPVDHLDAALAGGDDQALPRDSDDLLGVREADSSCRGEDLQRALFGAAVVAGVVGGHHRHVGPRQRGDPGQQLRLVGLHDHQVVRLQGGADELGGRGLRVHRVHRDQPPHPPRQQLQKLAHTRYFVALLGDRELAQHQSGTVGEHRHQVRGGGFRAQCATQGLAVKGDGHQPGWVQPGRVCGEVGT